jgi:hypothetical protein
VECADRIATMATERTLEPVRSMARYDALSAVAVRARLGGRRFEITIRKAWPEGSERPPAYRWEVREVGGDGRPGSDEEVIRVDADSAEKHSAEPEGAYWIALEAAQRALESARA